MEPATSMELMQVTTDMIVAVLCALVAATTFYSVKAQRRSTAAMVLTLFGALVFANGIYVLFHKAEFAKWADWLELIALAALTIAIAAMSLGLVRLIPRAAQFQDRKHLKAAARELRQSKQRFERAIHGSFSGLWEWNVDDNTVWYSPRFRELLGYGVHDEFPDVLDSWKSALHPVDRQQLLDAINQHLYDHGGFDVEYRLRMKSGEYRWFNSRGMSIRDPKGRPYLMSGSIHDVQDRKQAEEDVRQRDKYLLQKQKMESLGELAGGMAHEFNNLLQAISGQIQFAQKSLPDESGAKKDLTIAAGLIDQSAKITRQLLDFSRRRPKSLAAINPNELVSELADVLRPMLGMHIELRLHLGDRVEIVQADAGALQQALLNLCINARDAMPLGGKLVLRTCRANMREHELTKFPDMKPGSYVMISVSDSGEGMSSDTKQRIFEPFFTTKPIGKGSGLGLSVVYNVVKECSGAIDVESDPGHGTTFVIWLPVAQQSASRPACRPTTPRTHEHSSTATILYAEDDDVIRRTTTRMLQEHGHCVLEAANGKQALATFCDYIEEIDVALLDVAMPQLRGDEVLMRLRDQKPDLPVVFCSGCASPLLDQDALDLANTWLITKPFQSDELIQLLDCALAATPRGQLTT